MRSLIYRRLSLLGYCIADAWPIIIIWTQYCNGVSAGYKLYEVPLDWTSENSALYTIKVFCTNKISIASYQGFRKDTLAISSSKSHYDKRVLAFLSVECHNEIKHFYTQTLPKIATIIPIHKQLRWTRNSFHKITLVDICIINSKYFTHLKVISQLKA